MGMLTFKYRVKDATAGRRLSQHSTACNQVWNFCVATQREAERRYAAGGAVRWPGAFDFVRLCIGVASDLGLHSDTVQTICRQFVASRDLHRRCPRFRASFGAKRALGWIPLTGRAVRFRDGAVVYLKRQYRVWLSREIEGDIKSGAFVQDARGRWYACLQCEVADDLPKGPGTIGIDLGLKSLATTSDGEAIPAMQHYRKYEASLGRAQRARSKRRVRAIAAKIANSRRHHLHVVSARLTKKNSTIVVGNVNAAKLAKTGMAKSVLDAGWSTFRHMLRYKLARRQAVYVEADERFSSQTCSCCGSIPASSPKGMGALGVRHWECSDCGSVHDRDRNAAQNILRVGLERQAPVEGMAVRLGG